MTVFLITVCPIITEVMANVKGPESGPGDRNEFVEIYNNSTAPIDVSGWFFTDLDATDTICPWIDTTILIKYPDVIINSTILSPHHYALVLDREYTRPDTDQYQEPYAIPDSTLILTTDDTSLGNGLSTTDPILLYSPDSSCSTSFGTPFDTLDTIPFDPGDGMSLEIIDIEKGDLESNWFPSLDPSGSTPGRDNSTFTNYDLAISDLILHPPVGSEKTEVKVEVEVKNCGLQPVDNWEIAIFDDLNKDYSLDENEEIKRERGDLTLPGKGSTIKLGLGRFSLGEHQLGVRVIFDGDVNRDNDTGFVCLSIVPRVGFFSLAPKLLYPEKDRLQVEYQLPSAGGRLKVSIYSDRGNKVTDLIDQDVDHTQGTIFWDGQRARIGYYIVLFDYEVSGKSYRDKKVFVLAR